MDVGAGIDAGCRGDVPGENPLIRIGFVGEERGGEPTGPKSTFGEAPCLPVNRFGSVGVEIGMNGLCAEGGERPEIGLFDEPLAAVSTPLSRADKSCSNFSAPLSDLIISNDVKSLSLSVGAVAGGAGAALEIDMGGRPPSGRTRVGAVGPTKRLLRTCPLFPVLDDVPEASAPDLCDLFSPRPPSFSLPA